MNHQRPAFEIGWLQPGSEYWMVGVTIFVNIEGGQITEVAIPIGAFVSPRAGRIKVTAGGQSRHFFTILYSRAAIWILMDVESMQARRETF
ncbi:MAG: hypothetical protein PVG34_04395 [Desulfobacterales bacterium]